MGIREGGGEMGGERVDKEKGECGRKERGPLSCRSPLFVLALLLLLWL